MEQISKETELRARLDEIDKQMRGLKKEATATLRDTIKLAADAIFEKHPQVKQIYWSQWPPYFNDGDACIFRINEVYFLDTEEHRNKHPEDLDEYDEVPVEGETDWQGRQRYTYKLAVSHTWPRADGTDKDKAINASLKDFESLLNKHEEFLQYVFGEHAKIRITRDGVSVEEYYDHD